jgi:hypothetical protein
VSLQDRGDLITEALWLFGPEAYECRSKLPARSVEELDTRAFPNGGIYVMQHKKGLHGYFLWFHKPVVSLLNVFHGFGIINAVLNNWGPRSYNRGGGIENG